MPREPRALSGVSRKRELIVAGRVGARIGEGVEGLLFVSTEGAIRLGGRCEEGAGVGGRTVFHLEPGRAERDGGAVVSAFESRRTAHKWNHARFSDRSFAPTRFRHPIATSRPRGRSVTPRAVSSQAVALGAGVSPISQRVLS